MRWTGCVRSPPRRSPPGEKPRALALAATDPANPYGAALPWPERVAEQEGAGPSGHRPGRKAGALVVLVDGALAVYVERGGRTLLTFRSPSGGPDSDSLEPAFEALAAAVRQGALGRMTVEKADGARSSARASGPAPCASHWRPPASSATPRGLRLRA